MTKNRFILLLLIFLCSVSMYNILGIRRVEGKIDCQLPLPRGYTFMEHAMLFTNNPPMTSICYMPSEYNWENNLYFTGNDLIKNTDSIMLVPRYDTCELKRSFYKWLDQKIRSNYDNAKAH